ncbi:MAG: tRNA (N(6)-L-threonylcarbamoyladenosine(37)-C(2))-methylthiotransferase MtaB [Candidatus Zixiibacteriota bacterium]|nr:MAG: tRNA (N(6)-L-threonylcarbamoyladenosine(37)-C(2))-methylthiotransferase MtaB [candidate division Zixibacteria bacterium]
MRRVAFETIGCRLNQYETEKIAAELSRYGFERVEFDREADLYIINTCTVTGRADSSSRNIISRAARREQNPAVVVIGCYVDADREKVAHLNGVDLVVNNDDKENIAAILSEKFPHLFEKRQRLPRPEVITEFHEHNRAWIKIGDGCNQRCAYCIIPIVRGELTNRSADEIVTEINALVNNGYNEVVLTGIHIGQYRWGDLKSPADLVRFILHNSSVSRIRLSSIEPQEVDVGLVRAMNDGAERVCRHLHIPLQSGSDRILKAMRRPYNTGKYLDIISHVKDTIHNVVIGGDVIVGFPGETDDDFRKSIETADCGLIDYLHVFSYSDRPGTVASDMPDKIKPDVIKQRNSALREISKKRYAEALKREVGETVYVISEHRVKGREHYWGITDNYLKVFLPENLGGSKEILKMKITGATNSNLIGNPI